MCKHKCVLSLYIKVLAEDKHLSSKGLLAAASAPLGACRQRGSDTEQATAKHIIEHAGKTATHRAVLFATGWVVLQLKINSHGN